jgi:DegV family protein with EDD domain
MIRIVTDSSSDLPAEVCDRLGIRVVPLTVRFGAEEFVDGVDLTPDGFWERVAGTGALPETAAPSAGAFLDAFEGLEAEGASGIVAICLSSELSATYQAAVIAAEKLGDGIPVRVVDSAAVSMALGLQVMGAAESSLAGADVDRVAALALGNRSKTNILAALDTLEYLRRGGRVGGVQALLGGLLDIKPLLHFADGVVASAGRVRTRSKAIDAITAKAAVLAPDLDALSVIHTGSADLDRLLTSLAEVAPGHRPTVARIGPVVGTHAGPGAIGIAYRLR